MHIEIVSNAEASAWVESLHLARPSPALGILLGGDRWLYAEQVVLAIKDGEKIGIATIAPHGEMENGEPTIIAVYVVPAHRKRGVGYQLLEAAIDHMLQQGISSIRIDALHTSVLRLIDKLPVDKRAHLHVVDQTLGGVMDKMLEA